MSAASVKYADINLKFIKKKKVTVLQNGWEAIPNLTALQGKLRGKNTSGKLGRSASC